MEHYCTKPSLGRLRSALRPCVYSGLNGCDLGPLGRRVIMLTSIVSEDTDRSQCWQTRVKFVRITSFLPTERRGVTQAADTGRSGSPRTCRSSFRVKGLRGNGHRRRVTGPGSRQLDTPGMLGRQLPCKIRMGRHQACRRARLLRYKLGAGAVLQYRIAARNCLHKSLVFSTTFTTVGH